MRDDPTQGTLEDVGEEYTRMTYALDDRWSVRVLLDEKLNILGVTIASNGPLHPPDGGLSAELLGKIRVGDLRRRFLTLHARDTGRWAASQGLDDAPPYPDLLAELENPTTQEWMENALRRIRPPRSPDTDRMDRLAVAAFRYVEAYKRDPRRVLVEMVEEYKREGDPISYSTARERVREARKAGFLVGGRRGRAGAMEGPALAEWQEQQTEGSKE